MSSARVVEVWCERCWPVLAGAAVAVGLLAMSRLVGSFVVALLVVGLWLFLAVVLYGAGSESGLRARTAVRIGLVVSVSVLSLLGLTELLPAAGWFIALAVGATSPALAHQLAPHVRRGMEGLGSHTPTGSAPDQAAVDRVFEKIVADLQKDDA